MIYMLPTFNLKFQTLQFPRRLTQTDRQKNTDKKYKKKFFQYFLFFYKRRRWRENKQNSGLTSMKNISCQYKHFWMIFLKYVCNDKEFCVYIMKYGHYSLRCTLQLKKRSISIDLDKD